MRRGLRSKALLVVGILAAYLQPVVLAEGTSWSNWRGPYHNGSSDTTHLPDTLTPDNAAWSYSLPGPAGSTPAIYNGKLFLTSTESGSEKLIALCLDAADGTLLWQKTIAQGPEPRGRNTAAAPSPIVDDDRVYFLFGNGEFLALTHDGTELWRRNLVDDYGPFSLLFGYGASPLLFDGTLYVAVIRRGQVYGGRQPDEPLVSYLLAVDPATGETLFYRQRPSDANDETTNSYITPVVAQVNNEPLIVLFGADYLTTHDPATGQERMRYQYDTSHNPRARNIPTPIADGRMLYVSLPRGTAAAGFDLTDSSAPQRWRTESSGPDASTPVLYQGHFYMVNDRNKMMVCVEPSSGKVLWQGQLDQRGMHFASITAADGKLYTVNEAGVVNVVAADPAEFRLLSTTDFGQRPVHSSLALADSRVYLRTAETLYCFEN